MKITTPEILMIIIILMLCFIAVGLYLSFNNLNERVHKVNLDLYTLTRDISPDTIVDIPKEASKKFAKGEVYNPSQDLNLVMSGEYDDPFFD